MHSRGERDECMQSLSPRFYRGKDAGASVPYDRLDQVREQMQRTPRKAVKLAQKEIMVKERCENERMKWERRAQDIDSRLQALEASFSRERRLKLERAGTVDPWQPVGCAGGSNRTAAIRGQALRVARTQAEVRQVVEGREGAGVLLRAMNTADPQIEELLRRSEKAVRSGRAALKVFNALSEASMDAKLDRKLQLEEHRRQHWEEVEERRASKALKWEQKMDRVAQREARRDSQMRRNADWRFELDRKTKQLCALANDLVLEPRHPDHSKVCKAQIEGLMSEILGMAETVPVPADRSPRGALTPRRAMTPRSEYAPAATSQPVSPRTPRAAPRTPNATPRPVAAAREADERKGGLGHRPGSARQASQPAADAPVLGWGSADGNDEFAATIKQRKPWTPRSQRNPAVPAIEDFRTHVRLRKAGKLDDDGLGDAKAILPYGGSTTPCSSPRGSSAPLGDKAGPTMRHVDPHHKCQDEVSLPDATAFSGEATHLQELLRQQAHDEQPPAKPIAPTEQEPHGSFETATTPAGPQEDSPRLGMCGQHDHAQTNFGLQTIGDLALPPSLIPELCQAQEEVRSPRSPKSVSFLDADFGATESACLDQAAWGTMTTMSTASTVVPPAPGLDLSKADTSSSVPSSLRMFGSLPNTPGYFGGDDCFDRNGDGHVDRGEFELAGTHLQDVEARVKADYGAPQEDPYPNVRVFGDLPNHGEVYKKDDDGIDKDYLATPDLSHKNDDAGIGTSDFMAISGLPLQDVRPDTPIADRGPSTQDQGLPSSCRLFGSLPNTPWGGALPEADRSADRHADVRRVHANTFPPDTPRGHSPEFDRSPCSHAGLPWSAGALMPGPSGPGPVYDRTLFAHADLQWNAGALTPGLPGPSPASGHADLQWAADARLPGPLGLSPERGRPPYGYAADACFPGHADLQWSVDTRSPGAPAGDGPESPQPRYFLQPDVQYRQELRFAPGA